MSDEEGGMLGDLPRSRPGRRSAKRDPAAPRPRAGSAAKAATRPPSPSAAEPAAQPGRAPEAEIVIGAARAAAGVARAGIQTASRIAGDVFKRLPRP